MNPNIQQLNDDSQFMLMHSVPYKEMRSFVVKHVASRSILLRLYSIFQIVSIIAFFAFMAYEIVRIFTEGSPWNNLLWMIGGLVFSFTFLILIHEQIHMTGFQILGRKNLRIGGSLRQFLFYVEADKEVVNRHEYLFVAILPFIIVLLLGVILSLMFWGTTYAYFFISITCIHSLFCAGDFAIISLMYQNHTQTYTYDDAELKTAYFFKRKEVQSTVS